MCQLLDKCTQRQQLQQRVEQLKQKLADGEDVQSDDISVIHLLDDSNADKDKLIEQLSGSASAQKIQRDLSEVAAKISSTFLNCTDYKDMVRTKSVLDKQLQITRLDILDVTEPPVQKKLTAQFVELAVQLSNVFQKEICDVN